MIPSANRQTLTHCVISEEQGKPNYLHFSMESEPQGEPIDKWVEDVGKSEYCLVMRQIRGVPLHESEQTSDGCWISGKSWNDLNHKVWKESGYVTYGLMDFWRSTSSYREGDSFLSPDASRHFINA